jgi:hypothetical protein
MPSSISLGQNANGLEPRIRSKGKAGSFLFPYNNGSTIAQIYQLRVLLSALLSVDCFSTAVAFPRPFPLTDRLRVRFATNRWPTGRLPNRPFDALKQANFGRFVNSQNRELTNRPFEAPKRPVGGVKKRTLRVGILSRDFCC